MTSKSVGAAEFKADCLRLIDDMNRDHLPVTITKRGKPVAVLSPVPAPAPRSIIGAMKGTATYVGDPFTPATDPADWAANS